MKVLNLFKFIIIQRMIVVLYEINKDIKMESYA